MDAGAGGRPEGGGGRGEISKMLSSSISSSSSSPSPFPIRQKKNRKTKWVDGEVAGHVDAPFGLMSTSSAPPQSEGPRGFSERERETRRLSVGHSRSFVMSLGLKIPSTRSVPRSGHPVCKRDIRRPFVTGHFIVTRRRTMDSLSTFGRTRDYRRRFQNLADCG